MRHFWLTLSGLLISAEICLAQEANALASAAQGILKERCFSCHGEGGSNEGGLNYVLNRKRLIRELVVPGSAESSKLFERIKKGEMPPDGDRIPETELETLHKWIEDGATPFEIEKKREFITPADVMNLMLKDLEQANERDRTFYRYFTLTHLYNSGLEDNEIESHRQGLSKLINSLSWGREVRPPQSIDPAKTILRIDLRHYKWNENDAWTHILLADPYRVVYSSKEAEDCYAMTKCELPHVRADWFVFAASRPPLYHVILFDGVLHDPTNVKSLERHLGVDVSKNLADYNDVVRAGFFPSGVSKSNRLIERHVSSHGAYWKSYDFKPMDPNDKAVRRRNLKANPTGPGGINGFDHDGGEMIFSLPNGLQGYMLTDSAGRRIDKGPTDVVVDKEAVKRGRDPDVVNGVSCMSCHWSGMLSKTDQIRDHVLGQPAAYSAEVVDFVKAVYVRKTEFLSKLKEDRDRFEAAVKRCGAPLSKTEPVSALAYQFHEPLDLDLAAAEAGVSPSQFVELLRNHSELGRELGGLLQGQPVSRDTFVIQFPTVIGELKVGEFLRTIQGAGTETLLPQNLEYITSKSSGMKLVSIPAGTFTMGSPAHESWRLDKEGPPHRVRISHPFYMGVTEVTQSQYEKVMGRNPSRFKSVGREDTRDFPVDRVSWFDAIEFCNRLSELDELTPCYTMIDVQRENGSIHFANVSISAGNGYRLPTEAEWEYACRATTSSPFHFGNSLNAKIANIGGNDQQWRGSILDRTTTVGSFPRNQFGLFDMHGNVWEWCFDVLDEKEYSNRSGTTNDPVATSGSDRRVLRGGGFNGSANMARAAFRGKNMPGKTLFDVGFRVVR